jgi:hypothetical protein
MVNKKAGKGSAPQRGPRPRTRATGGGKDKTAASRSAIRNAGGKAAGKPSSPSTAARRPGAKPSAGRTSPPPRGGPRKPAGSSRKTLPAVPVVGKAKTAPATGARPKAPGARATAAPPAKTAVRRPAGSPKPAQDIQPPGPETGLSEEDAIRSAKYTPRDLPPRLFEEERFLFPETYGLNRVRLLVRDPEWLFAYWDVSPAAMKELARSLGERTLAVSRLTLRITDPVSGGSSDVLLPAGARWWYVRADSTPRSYKAELGLTLPSGEYRRISESNTVVTPRVGPSPRRATRRMSYGQAGTLPADAASGESLEDARALPPPPGPWSAPSIDGAMADASPSGKTGRGAGPKGGASDSFQPPGGASDVHRR